MFEINRLTLLSARLRYFEWLTNVGLLETRLMLSKQFEKAMNPFSVKDMKVLVESIPKGVKTNDGN